MKSYLEIKTPISKGDLWFVRFRSKMNNMPVEWQGDGTYHITMAFIDETPNIDVVSSILKEDIDILPAQIIIFDKIDIFEANSGDMYIINLTTRNIPIAFSSAVSRIRENLQNIGATIQLPFRLHVTLGRVFDISKPLSEYKRMIENFEFSPFELRLCNVRYRIYRGDFIASWVLS